MKNQETQDIMTNFIQKKVDGYISKNNQKNFEEHKKQRTEHLLDIQNNSKFLNSKYRRYENYDVFKAQILNSSKMLPIFIFITITLVVAMYNILSIINNKF